ncbi:MAG: hypothetical protein ACK5MY_00880 [Jhaorihella sp.]
MRIIPTALVLGVLGACSPAVPDSGAGIGFDNSPQSQRAREAALAGGGTITGDPLIPPSAVSSETLEPAPGGWAAQPQDIAAAPGQPMPLAATAQAPAVPAAQVPAPSGSGDSDDIARETAAALAAASANSGVPPVQASPSNPPPGNYGNAAISDENDFAAVSSRETIQSDAQRIAKNSEQYQQIAPTALPPRSGGDSPNIVRYALAASNPVGTRIYSRTGFNLAAKAARNCGKYPSDDQAQIAFLDRGGPERDRLGLDPDGDGYACAWDPAPFRKAVQN